MSKPDEAPALNPQLPEQGRSSWALILTSDVLNGASPVYRLEIAEAIATLIGGNAQYELVQNYPAIEREPVSIAVTDEMFSTFATRSGEFTERLACKTWRTIIDTHAARKHVRDWESPARYAKAWPLRFFDEPDCNLLDLHSLRAELDKTKWWPSAWHGGTTKTIKFMRAFITDNLPVE